jgi:membrane protein YqaA with SNARE-associated domain
MAKSPPASGLRQQLPRLLALIAVVGISVYVYSIRDQAHHLRQYGYPGLFFLSILANATVILPAPSLVITFAAGGVFSPFWVGLITGAGAALGELTGYLAGFSGQAVIENRQLYDRLAGWMKRYGGGTILVLAVIPNPLFDLAGICAGALKMPVYKFLFWCMLGKTIKMLVVAFAGAYSVEWVIRLFS